MRDGEQDVRYPSGLVACLLASLALASSGCVILDAFQAAEHEQPPPPNETRFDRAREGEGSGFVPAVTDDCDADLAAIEEVRDIREEHGLDGAEQVALRQLVAAAADCPDNEG